MTRRGLFPLPPASEASLSDRQREALAILRDRYPEGSTSWQLGIEFVGQTYARSTGLGILRALKRAGLCRQGAAGVFYAIVADPEPDTPDPRFPAFNRDGVPF